MTELAPHVRGRTFRREFRLSGDAVGSDFDEIKFTVRQRLPDLTVADDASAAAQVAMTNGDITFDPSDEALGTIVIAAEATTAWKLGLHHWELTGRIDSDPVETIPLDKGVIFVEGDVTRVP